jgi:hypothetical protein
MLEAHDFAQALKHPVWDFAVEIRSLREAGLTNNQIRWLVCSGYIEHAIERTELNSEKRVFHQVRSLALYEQSCFVLTSAGILTAREIELGQCQSAFAGVNHETDVAGDDFQRTVPRWDTARRELHWKTRLVKKFRVSAPNQETILTVFQEENWPPRIDDPLRPDHSTDPKERLHDTIKNLNRRQTNPSLIHFRGDGTGAGVRWDVCLPPQTSPRDPLPTLACTRCKEEDGV